MRTRGPSHVPKGTIAHWDPAWAWWGSSFRGEGAGRARGPPCHPGMAVAR